MLRRTGKDSKASASLSQTWKKFLQQFINSNGFRLVITPISNGTQSCIFLRRPERKDMGTIIIRSQCPAIVVKAPRFFPVRHDLQKMSVALMARQFQDRFDLFWIHKSWYAATMSPRRSGSKSDESFQPKDSSAPPNTDDTKASKQAAIQATSAYQLSPALGMSPHPPVF